MKSSKIDRAALVYQAGIANVFAVESFNQSDYGRDARRLLQADFSTCVNFARGVKAADIPVVVFACNEAGDITHSHWSDDLDNQPFSDKFAKIDGYGFLL